MRIGDIISLHSLSILKGILSGPAALCGFRFKKKLFMPVSVMLMFCVRRFASVGVGFVLYQE